jgi:hypothetical protein
LPLAIADGRRKKARLWLKSTKIAPSKFKKAQNINLQDSGSDIYYKDTATLKILQYAARARGAGMGYARTGMGYVRAGMGYARARAAMGNIQVR